MQLVLYTLLQYYSLTVSNKAYFEHVNIYISIYIIYIQIRVKSKSNPNFYFGASKVAKFRT